MNENIYYPVSGETASGLSEAIEQDSRRYDRAFTEESEARGL